MLEFHNASKIYGGADPPNESEKSHLNAQADWSNQDRDPACPRCRQEPETLSYVVQCPALEGDRRGKNKQAFDISPDSGLWKGTKKGMKLLNVFSSYVLRNRINFPTKMGEFPFTRNAILVS